MSKEKLTTALTQQQLDYHLFFVMLIIDSVGKYGKVANIGVKTYGKVANFSYNLYGKVANISRKIYGKVTNLFFI